MDNMTGSGSETDISGSETDLATAAAAAKQGLAPVAATTSAASTQGLCSYHDHGGYIDHWGKWVEAEEPPLPMAMEGKKRLRRELSLSSSASTSSVSMDEPPAPVSGVLTGLKRLRVASSSGLCTLPLQVGWDEEKSGRPDPPPPQCWHDSNQQHASKFVEQQNIYPQDDYKEEEKLQGTDTVQNDRDYHGVDIQNRYFRGIRVQPGIHDVNYGQVNSLLRQLHLERVSNSHLWEMSSRLEADEGLGELWSDESKEMSSRGLSMKEFEALESRKMARSLRALDELLSTELTVEEDFEKMRAEERKEKEAENNPYLRLDMSMSNAPDPDNWRREFVHLMVVGKAIPIPSKVDGGSCNSSVKECEGLFKCVSPIHVERREETTSSTLVGDGHEGRPTLTALESGDMCVVGKRVELCDRDPAMFMDDTEEGEVIAQHGTLEEWIMVDRSSDTYSDEVTEGDSDCENSAPQVQEDLSQGINKPKRTRCIKETQNATSI